MRQTLPQWPIYSAALFSEPHVPPLALGLLYADAISIAAISRLKNMPLDLTKNSSIITGNAASMAFWGECRHCKTVAVAPMVMKASRLSTCKEVIATLNASSRIPKTAQERTLRANSPFRAEAHRTMQSLPARRQKGPTRPIEAHGPCLPASTGR